MVLPGLALPDDVDALKAMVLSMAREQAASEARIAVAEARIAASEAEVARLQAVEKSADETSLPTLAPGSGKTTKAWLWAYARDDRPFGETSPPMVAYRFEDSRGADCVARHLAGFNGILQVDGYSAYTSLAKARAKAGSNEAIQLAGCWAHLRRKFYDLHISGVSRAATDTIIAMTELWKVEDEVRGKDADTRATLRQEKSAAIVAALFDLWEKELRKISGKSKTAEAIRYALTRREALERFLADGRIEIDSNIVERAIRPQTKRVSLCTPYSSICKHWKRVCVDGATRAALTGDRGFYGVGREVRSPDLIRRSRNDLYGGEDIALDKTADGVVRHAERLGGLQHGQPFAAFLSR